MTTTLASGATERQARIRRTSADFLAEATRAARTDRVRAREARAMAQACEHRARRAPGQSAMYLREALRLRREAAAFDVDAALHDEAVAALWLLIEDGVVQG